MSLDKSRQLNNSSKAKSDFKPPMGPGRGGRPGMRAVEKPKAFLPTMKKLALYLKPFWLAISLVFLFAILSTIFIILSPKILGDITNQIVLDTVVLKTAIDFSIILSLTIKLLVLYVLSAIFNYIQDWLMTGVSQKISYKLRRDMSEKINRLPLAYFDKRNFGELLSRVTNDVDTVGQTLNQSLTQMVTSITLIVGILIIMFSISWKMTLVSIMLIPLSFILIALIIKKSQHYFKEQQDSLGEINGHIEEMYAGHIVMKVFNGEKDSVKKFKKINDNLYNSAWKSQFLSGLMMPIMTFVSNLGFVGVSVLGGYLAINGKIRIGDIQAFIQYVNKFNRPIIQTANIANVLQSTAASAERVFEFLEEKEEESEANKESVKIDVRGALEFKNVSFSYDKSKKVIKNFNASISQGQKVAIVGPTGAGKTTIVNLLMRFYELDQGAIFLDGVDISKMKRSKLRRLFGMVLQDTWLFDGSILDNIAYSKEGASKKEIEAVSKAAQIDHFIHALPGDYNFKLNEESSNISQGEKQLLTIARAMLAKTPMLILDEATSSVDVRTELLIQRAMDNLMKGKTSFVIAHRLSTIKSADLILVMHKGSIVEQGAHQELLSKKGLYAKLYNSQFANNLAK